MARFFRFIGRLIGLLLLLAMLAVLGHDLLSWRAEGSFTPTSLGQLWIYLNRASLVAVERSLPPTLWNPPLVSLLRIWAVPAFALPGILLYWSCRKRRG